MHAAQFIQKVSQVNVMYSLHVTTMHQVFVAVRVVAEEQINVSLSHLLTRLIVQLETVFGNIPNMNTNVYFSLFTCYLIFGPY